MYCPDHEEACNRAVVEPLTPMMPLTVDTTRQPAAVLTLARVLTAFGLGAWSLVRRALAADLDPNGSESVQQSMVSQGPNLERQWQLDAEAWSSLPSDTAASVQQLFRGMERDAARLCADAQQRGKLGLLPYPLRSEQFRDVQVHKMRIRRPGLRYTATFLPQSTAGATPTVGTTSTASTSTAAATTSVGATCTAGTIAAVTDSGSGTDCFVKLTTWPYGEQVGLVGFTFLHRLSCGPHGDCHCTSQLCCLFNGRHESLGTSICDNMPVPVRQRVMVRLQDHIRQAC